MTGISRRRLLLSLGPWIPALARAQHDDARHAFDPRDYARWTFARQGVTHDVWSRGEGPGVIVLHELPGPTAEHFHLVERLVAERFRVHAPIVFGTPGKPFSALRTAIELYAQCHTTSEFECWDRRRVSPIHDWLVALCGALGVREPGPLGAIGMCLTGAMPLAMLRARNVVAPVVCQPTLPIGVASGLALLPSDIEHARVRAVSDDLRVLLLRYTSDHRCPQARADALRALFGERLRCYENTTDHGHSTLVHSFDPRAFATTIDFLRTELSRPHPGARR